jgi:hypothetical protein
MDQALNAKSLFTVIAVSLTFGGAVAQPQPAYRTISAQRIDSACIGNTSDAVCALETLFACTRLGKPELCNKVGVPGMPPFPARGVTEYRIVDGR